MVLAHQLVMMLLTSMTLCVGVMVVTTLIFQLLMPPVLMSVALDVVVVIVLLVPASRVKNVVALPPPQASPVRNVVVLAVARASRAKPEWSLHMSNFEGVIWDDDHVLK